MDEKNQSKATARKKRPIYLGRHEGEKDGTETKKGCIEGEAMRGSLGPGLVPTAQKVRKVFLYQIRSIRDNRNPKLPKFAQKEINARVGGVLKREWFFNKFGLSEETTKRGDLGFGKKGREEELTPMGCVKKKTTKKIGGNPWGTESKILNPKCGTETEGKLFREGGRKKVTLASRPTKSKNYTEKNREFVGVILERMTGQGKSGGQRSPKVSFHKKRKHG